MRDEAERYRLLLENRRVREARRLDELSPGAKRRQERTGIAIQTPVGVVIAKAARVLGERTRAASAWQGIAHPNWVRDVTVEGIVGTFRDTLLLRVDSSTVLYELRRQQPALERQLAKLVPGIRRLRLRVAGRESAGDDGRD